MLLSEKRSNLIYIAKDGVLSPSVDALYGPYESLDSAILYINEFCDDLEVSNVPAGLKFAISGDNGSVTEFKYNGGEFSADNVELVIDTPSSFAKVVEDGVINVDYDDTDIYLKIDELSGKVENAVSTPYDDTEIKERIDALERKQPVVLSGNVVAYDDTEIKSQLSDLSDKAVKYQEFEYNGQVRKTIQLANHDTISAIGANCTEGEPNGYAGGENLEGEGFNLVMLSKWNVADFGSSRVSMNLNSKDGVVKINDEKVIATTDQLDPHADTIATLESRLYKTSKNNVELSSEKDIKVEQVLWTEETAAAENAKHLVADVNGVQPSEEGYISTYAEGYTPVSAGDVQTPVEYSSLNLSSKNKVAVKSAGDFELGVKDIVIPIEMTKGYKYTCGNYSVENVDSVDEIKNALPKLKIEVDKNNLTGDLKNYVASLNDKGVSVLDIIDTVNKFKDVDEIAGDSYDDSEISGKVNALESIVQAISGTYASRDYVNAQINQAQLNGSGSNVDLSEYVKTDDLSTYITPRIDDLETKYGNLNTSISLATNKINNLSGRIISEDAIDNKISGALANFGGNVGGSTVSKEDVEKIINDLNDPKLRDFGEFKINNLTLDEAINANVLKLTLNALYGTMLTVELTAGTDNVFTIHGSVPYKMQFGVSNTGLVQYTVQTANSETHIYSDDAGNVKEFFDENGECIGITRYGLQEEEPAEPKIDVVKYFDDTYEVNKFSTTVYFDGDTLIEDSNIYGNGNKPILSYAPIVGKITFKIYQNAHVYVTDTTESTDLSDIAVIQSANNMVLSGTGSLTIVSAYGNHGIKAEKLEINDRLHIYADVKHDAIHGTEELLVNNGLFYIKNAKDCFGTGENGMLNVYYGDFYFENYDSRNNAFDCKNGEGIIYGGNMYEIEGGNRGNRYSANVKEYTVSDYEEGAIYVSSVEFENITDEGVEKLELNLEHQYEISNSYALVTGHIEHQILVSAAKAEITIENAYINYNGNGPSIYYNLGQSNFLLKFRGVNYIYQSAEERLLDYDYDAIKSENNIKLCPKSKSKTYVTSKLDDGVDGSDVTIYNGSGDMYFINSYNRGIKATSLIVGNECDSKTGLWDATNKKKAFDGCIYAFDNVKSNGGVPNTGVTTDLNPLDYKLFGFADIYARNGKHTKGTVYMQEYNAENKIGCKGNVICNSFNSCTEPVSVTNLYYCVSTTSVGSAISYKDEQAVPYVQTVTLTNKSDIITTLMDMINDLSGRLYAYENK